MTVTFVTIDEKVPTWRTLWPARELVRRGHDVEVYAAAAGIPLPEVEPTDDVTYVFHIINRAWNFEGHYVTFADIANDLRQGGRLIVSFDDDWTRMFDVQSRPIHPLSRAHHERLPELARMASKVIVSTPRLAEVFGRWNTVEVVPNVMPESILQMERPARLERIAWMGEMYVHGLDWNLLGPYAKDLPPLRLVGSGEAAAEKIRSWGARDVEWTNAMLNQRDLYTEMGRAVGAIIPLADTGFNRGKSWSKPMEFLARGVPVVASAHDEYKRLDEATGAVPTYTDPADLVEAANELLEDRASDSGAELPDRLRAAGLTMEQSGGDNWERALDLLPTTVDSGNHLADPVARSGTA